jgi:phosphoglycerate kinase
MRALTVEIASTLRGHTVLLRASLNVPVENGVVRNPFRLDAALKTVTLLSSAGARVVLISHIDGDGSPSLRPVYEYLKTKVPLVFVEDVAGERARAAVHALTDGHVALIENVRRDAGEVANDDAFARRLASLGDVYVNDDFAAAHRKHASIIGVPQYLPSYAGLQFVAEVEGLTKALEPKSPSLAIVGGAKFVTKEPLIRALLPKYDFVFVGGALAIDFYKAKGYEVGKSLVSDSPHLADLLTNSKVILPVDATVVGPAGTFVKDVRELLPNDTIYDIGPKSIETLKPLAAKARTVLWNGPLGNFEKGFSSMTEELAKVLADAPGVSVVGGGDTIAAIQKLGLNDKFEFLSTAGGAMLDFLAHGTLPGIEALKNAKTL